MTNPLTSRFLLVSFCCFAACIDGFSGLSRFSRRSSSRLEMTDDNNDNSFRPPSLPNPFRESAEMFKNMDDVMDDFFNKRMGNGEIFYGKRKYRPSGSVEGEYNGFGLTDKVRIDMTRQRKEEWLEEKRQREDTT